MTNSFCRNRELVSRASVNAQAKVTEATARIRRNLDIMIGPNTFLLIYCFCVEWCEQTQMIEDVTENVVR